LWLARGLEMAPADAEDLQLVARANLGGLYSEIPHLRAALSHPAAVNTAVFSPDGKTILTSSLLAAHLWDPATGKRPGKPLAHAKTVAALAFSPDGKKILTGSWDGTAQLWGAVSHKRLGKPLKHPREVLAVAFSPDGKTILTGCQDWKARLWEAA